MYVLVSLRQTLYHYVNAFNINFARSNENWNTSVKRLLITGANGVLGQRVVANMMESSSDIPLDIVGLDRSCGESYKIGSNNLSWHECDLAQFDIAAIMNVGRFDAVIHLAAITGQAAEKDPSLTNAINYDLTRKFQELCIEAKSPIRFVFASSIAAIGDAQGAESVDETVTCNPISQYGAAKLKCEDRIRGNNERGHDVWALRLPALMLRKTHRPGLPTSGFLSDLACALVEKGSAVSPMVSDYAVAVASFEDASRALARLAINDLPSDAPAVMNLPAFAATPEHTYDAVQKCRSCSISYPDQNDPRILALTKMWPKSLLSSQSSWLGVDQRKCRSSRMDEIIHEAL